MKIGFIIARIIAAILLIWALDKHPYSYYTLLRFIVCGVTAYGAYLSVVFEKIGWVWCLGIIALLFNPIIPIHLNKETWHVIDVVVAIILIVSLFILRKPKEESQNNEGFEE